MKRSILKVLLLLFVIDTASAQTIEDLNSRRIKERESIGHSIQSSGGSSGNGIDWDVDDDTWGLAYTYSPHFPLSLSVNRTWSYFQLGGELGFNLTGKRYDWDTDITAQPIGYVMAQPGFYCKYFSIQCGVGVLFDVRREIVEKEGGTTITSITINGETHTDVQQQTYSANNMSCGVNFCSKPSLTGFIPLSDDEFYLTINAGYIFVPKFKELNGFTVGIGIQFEL